MIYKNGDLMKAPEKIIIHGCNALGIMGSGVALAIKENFPEAFTLYRDFCEQHAHNREELLGQVDWVNTKGKLIGNCITQLSCGYGGVFVNYGAVRKCISEVNEYAFSKKVSEVAMPKIGAGLGGGDWDIIEDIINTGLTKTRPIIYVL